MTQSAARLLQVIMELSETIGYHGEGASRYAQDALTRRRQLALTLLEQVEGPAVPFAERLRQGDAHPADLTSEIWRWMNERHHLQTVTEFLGLDQAEYDAALKDEQVLARYLPRT